VKAQHRWFFISLWLMRHTRDWILTVTTYMYWHKESSCNANTLFLSAKEGSHYYQFKVLCDLAGNLNPRPLVPEVNVQQWPSLSLKMYKISCGLCNTVYLKLIRGNNSVILRMTPIKITYYTFKHCECICNIWVSFMKKSSST